MIRWRACTHTHTHSGGGDGDDLSFSHSSHNSQVYMYAIINPSISKFSYLAFPSTEATAMRFTCAQAPAPRHHHRNSHFLLPFSSSSYVIVYHLVSYQRRPAVRISSHAHSTGSHRIGGDEDTQACAVIFMSWQLMPWCTIYQSVWERMKVMLDERTYMYKMFDGCVCVCEKELVKGNGRDCEQIK